MPCFFVVVLFFLKETLNMQAIPQPVCKRHASFAFRQDGFHPQAHSQLPLTDLREGDFIV